MLPILFITMLLVWQNSAAGLASSLGSVEGVVLDEQGEPLPKATVFGLPEEDMGHQIRTTADWEGRFTLGGVPPGWVYLHAYKESAGYPYDFFAFFNTKDRKPVKVHIEAGKMTSNVVLKLGPRAAHLDFTIIDQDGMPLKSDSQLLFVRDDIPGTYRRGGTTGSILVPPVPFRLTVEAQGYQPWKSDLIDLKSGQVLQIVARLKPDEGGRGK